GRVAKGGGCAIFMDRHPHSIAGIALGKYYTASHLSSADSTRSLMRLSSSICRPETLRPLASRVSRDTRIVPGLAAAHNRDARCTAAPRIEVSELLTLPTWMPMRTSGA